MPSGGSSSGYVRDSIRARSQMSLRRSLTTIAREKQREWGLGSTEPPPYDLLSYIPRTSPAYSSPAHLAPLVDVLSRAFAAARGEGPPVFACVSEPPQHGKTETILHGLAHWLECAPQDALAYISYNDDIARDKSRKAKDYATLSGVELRKDSYSAQTWKTTTGGGLIARGILGGAITGQEALRCLVVDDPYKNRAEAESRLMRRRVDDELMSSVMTRVHASTSVVINHTRWHVDDQIGRLLKRQPDRWEHVNLPAISDGVALWEAGQPLAHLEALRETIGEYNWQSLYMGAPRPRDTQLFRGVSFYTDMPSSMSVAIGVDLAYSAKTQSDWSVAVVMGLHSGRYYVLEVVRRQVAAPQFLGDLQALQARYPGAPLLAYLSGTERGTADFFRQAGLPLQVEAATADKYIRAQPLSAAWNAGKVHLPQSAPVWLDGFLGCLLDFTGLNDPHDDDVDAAAAAFDALTRCSAPLAHRPRTARERRGWRGDPWR